jgi:NAD(P)-dependent dehydrogenase (short-subunit alcohol dehydrogenase family)
MDLGVAGRGFAIVGGSTGMGFAAAQVLAEEGANVALLARDEARSRAKAEQLEKAHGTRVVAIGVDGTRSDDGMYRAIDAAAEQIGPLRGLAVTAGPMNLQGPFDVHDEASWDWYYQVILMIGVRACRAVLPHLQRGGGGTIVLTSAYSARAPKVTIPPYSAMKAAVWHLAKNLAKTYGKDGIRANVVCPGLFDTEVNDHVRAKRAAQYGVPLEDAIYTHLSSDPTWGMRVGLGRGGRPREAGELIAFLLGDRAAYMTGAAINIDGGTDFM